METDNGSRVNTARPKSTGAGGGAGGHGWPGRVSAAPPEIPGLGGDESPPRSVMGSLGRNPSSASQGFAPADYVAIPRMKLEDELLLKYDIKPKKSMKVLNNKVVNTPGLEVQIDKRGTIYRVTSKDAAIRLAAQILFYTAKSSKGTVVHLNNRKMTYLLGLQGGRFDAFTISWLVLLFEELGFPMYKSRRRIFTIVNMESEVMKKVKAAKDVNETIEIIRKYMR